MKLYLLILILMFHNILFSQNIIDNFVHIGSSTIIRGSSSDGLKVPRDLDFHKDPQRDGELWVINETSAVFDGSNGGSTVTFYNAGSNSQWAEYRKDAFSAHFMHTASAIAFSDNGGFANALDVQDANNTPGGYFSGSTLWDSDTSIYARIHQNGPELGSHWDMIHQSPYSIGIASQTDNIYWIFDGFHQTIVKYDFQDPHPDSEHGGEDHSDGIVYRYDEVNVNRVPGLSSHMDIDEATGLLYFCDTGNQRVLRLNTSSGFIAQTLNPYGENLEGYYSMSGADFETIITDSLIQPTGIDVHENRLLISDFANGDIIIYNIETDEIYEIGRINTGLTNEVMSVKVGPDNSIWYVCTNLNELHQIVGILMGDINSDNLLSLSDILLLINHLMGSYIIEQDNQNSADINFDGVIDIFDLIHVCDLING